MRGAMSAASPSAQRSAPRPGERLADASFALLLVALIAARFAKAHHVGVLYDEAITWQLYAQDPAAALGRYDFANNHVLNSLAIGVAHGLFGSYEHFLRLPALALGTGFAVALAACIRSLVATPWLRVGVLALAAAHAFAFDLAFLARGYAGVLAASFCALAWLLRDEERPATARGLWTSVAVLAALSLLGLGSVPTAIFPVAVLGAIFLARAARRHADPRAVAAAGAVLVMSVILGSLALYWNLLDDMTRVLGRSTAGMNPGPYFTRFWQERVFVEGGPASWRGVAGASLGLLGLGAAAGLGASLHNRSLGATRGIALAAFLGLLSLLAFTGFGSIRAPVTLK